MLAQGAASDAEKLGFKQAINDFQRPGYGGPCPPRATACIIIIFGCSRSVDHLPIGGRPSCREVERGARSHTIAEVALVGVYQR
jgi:phosphatidylethanolamine-binding protein (PEBP) family uncharacterized protein